MRARTDTIRDLSSWRTLMNEAPSRGRRSGTGATGETSFALYGPDPLEPVRDAIIRRDPQALVCCFTPDGSLRVPRREGDIVIQGHEDLARAGRDLQTMVRELSWTPSRRLVSAGEVTEEAVVLAHQYQRRTSRASAPPPDSAEQGLRVPLRAVAVTEPDGLISSLTLWLDWAALSDPKGVASAGGAASALVAVARSRDDRGLRVLQTPAVPVITPRTVEPETTGPERPQPMSPAAIWWQLHRNTLAGSVMALAAVLLLGWVALNVLAPLRTGDASSSAAGAGSDSDGPGSSAPGEGTLRGADAGSPHGSSASRPGASGPGASASGSATGDDEPSGTSDPSATGAGPNGTGAPVLTSQKPDVRPTVQPGVEVVLLSDVLFRTGSFDLSRQANVRLDVLATQIRETGVQGNIQVNGYTDSVGSEADNMELSRQRALAVARALSARLDQAGVSLQVQAFGESDPRKTNQTDKGRRQNRRVTVVLPENR